MLNLEGSHFEKGTLELRLDAPSPKGLGWLITLGPVRARLIPMGGLIFTLLMTFNKAPARFFAESGWVEDFKAGLLVQDKIQWILLGACVLVYLIVFFVRKERLSLSMDRHKSSIYYEYQSSFVFKPRAQGIIPFSDVSKIYVGGPGKKEDCPHGWVEISSKGGAANPISEISFRLLSDDQFNFYPLNLSKILEKDPVGDWIDPDSIVPE